MVQKESSSVSEENLRGFPRATGRGASRKAMLEETFLLTFSTHLVFFSPLEPVLVPVLVVLQKLGASACLVFVFLSLAATPLPGPEVESCSTVPSPRHIHQAGSTWGGPGQVSRLLVSLF